MAPKKSSQKNNVERIKATTSLFERLSNTKDPLFIALDKLSEALSGKSAYDLSVWHRRILDSSQYRAYREQRERIIATHREKELAKKKKLLEADPKIKKDDIPMILQEFENKMVIYYAQIPEFREVLEIETDLEIDRLIIDGSKIPEFKEPERNLNKKDFDVLSAIAEFKWG